MNYLKISVLMTVALMTAASCKSQFDSLLASNDADAKYEGAFDYFNKGKYQKAASLFESMAFLTNGTPREDTVQYYWGLSNYRYKDYYTAEANFAKFIENFPQSPFTADAAYLRIDCLYRSTLRYELDQAPTYTCMTAIADYFRDFPDAGHEDECRVMLKDLNDRLDKKAFENARLYYKMEDYHILSMDSLDSDCVDNGMAIHEKDIPWVSRQLWAPDAIKLNGKYYLVFPAKDKDDTYKEGWPDQICDVEGEAGRHDPGAHCGTDVGTHNDRYGLSQRQQGRIHERHRHYGCRSG